MRIAGAVLAIFPLSIIILVQSLAAGTADALDGKGGNGGTYGFFVAMAFILGAALLFGRVVKGALGVFVAAAVLAWIGAANSTFGDLWVWGAVAAIYSGCIFWGIHRSARVAELPLPADTGSRSQPAPLAGPQPRRPSTTTPVRFDPMTGAPLNVTLARFDPMTGAPLNPAPARSDSMTGRPLDSTPTPMKGGPDEPVGVTRTVAVDPSPIEMAEQAQEGDGNVLLAAPGPKRGTARLGDPAADDPITRFDAEHGHG